MPNKMKRMVVLDQVSMCKCISRTPQGADLKIEHTDLQVRIEFHFFVDPPVEA